jgi:hypothetical protein
LAIQYSDVVSGREKTLTINEIYGSTQGESTSVGRPCVFVRLTFTSWLYGPTAVTPALLRLDPLWDPLRSDPAFQKLCEEKQP